MTPAQRTEHRKTEEETQLDVITARMLADMSRLQLAGVPRAGVPDELSHAAGGQGDAPATVDEPVHAPHAPWLDGGQGRSVPDAVDAGMGAVLLVTLFAGVAVGFLVALLTS